MSYASDDLVPLLAPPPQAGVGFRQGTILTFNPVTGANTIDVAGVTLTDLPILNTSDAANLNPGDIVGILTTGPSWFIAGRIIAPGAPGAGGALAIGRTTASFNTNSLSMTNGSYVGSSPAVTVYIGDAGRCIVMVGADLQYGAGAALGAGGAMSYEIKNADTGVVYLAPTDQAAFKAWNNISGGAWNAIHRATYVHYHSGIPAGRYTFTACYRSLQAPTAANFADRTIVVQPI